MGSDAVAPVELARQFHARGLVAMDAGKPQQAARLLNRALTTLASGAARDGGDDADLVNARVLITLAYAEFQLVGLDAALARLEAAEHAVSAADLPLHVSLHNQRGLFLFKVGQLEGALREFDQAESFFSQASAVERCRVLLNRGSVNLDLGSAAAARTALTRCADLAAAADLPLFQLKAMHNLGYAEFLAGDLPGALRLMAQAFRMDPTVSPGIALHGRARVLAEAGLARESDDVLAEAAAIFRRERLAHELGEVELDRASCALISGEVSQARRFAALARDRFRRRGNDTWRRSAELVLLQGDLAAGRPGSRLVEPALRLRDELRTDGLRLAARAAGLIAVEAYLATGRVDAAAAVADDLGPSDRRDPITGRLHARHVQARLDMERGDFRAAGRQARTGLSELADYQASFGSIDLQTASAVHGRRLAELILALALRSRRAAEVLAAAERARAVSTRLPVVRPPTDPQSAELLADLRHTVESLRGVRQDAAASAPLLLRRRELERAITGRRWTLAGTGPARRTAHLEEIRAGVAAAESTMVVFVEAASTMHAVVLRDGRLRLHHLGDAAAVTEEVRRARADLDVLAQPRLPGGLSAAVRSSFDRSVAELDRALLGPLQLDGQRLVIVSTGILGQLPWGTLPSLRGVPVVVAPSATAWLAAVQAPARRRKPQVVAIAGPDLVRAQHEVAGVVAAWGAAATHSEAANRPALVKAMAHGSVVHVAAHGVHQTENPLFSSLRLTDGPIFAHEMDQTARTPEHVVLSACELGLATVRPGDEALGLTSVLLHLGTRSVVAGVARVGDELAAETMIAYHQRLAAGQDGAAALADAARAVAAPVPFVCFGATWARPG
ncbi:MAG: CHAT domain-containing protein [Pseudonocardiales bacterium]